MLVRSNRLLDLAMVLVLGILTFESARSSVPDSIYDKHCSGRSALLCELVKSTQGAELFGFNPVMLALAVFLAIFLFYCGRRLWTGWSVKLSGDTISVPSFFGMKHVDVADVDAVEVRPKLFSLIAHINLTMRDKRKLSAANARVNDARAFARALRAKSPAPPAIPPAT